ncbi:hypothetical protein [Methylocystis iwaonis]|uniref:hypothetical protein n=1 Tax=Methylocystis iwaonis TaxID=2885079 RepID=UPI002E7B057F|nr:hypothetical protein [Methylocystis iwaonis]
MLGRTVFLLALLITVGLAACDRPSIQYALLSPAPARDPLFAPKQVTPGHLEYAEQPDTFAPVLTQHRAYPTQTQANYAYQRFLLRGRTTRDPPVFLGSTAAGAVRIRLFACRPGALNDTTGRIERARSYEVHCAADFLDPQDSSLFRKIVNFSYERGAWRMAGTAPPMAPAPWINPEPAPSDFLSWAPWGRRTTPY